MKVFTTPITVQKYILELKSKKKSVGFVPTMGALHSGHSSLIQKSKSENDITVVSIFVNPIQFNNKTDLDTYPSNLQKDKQLLKQLNCDILFLPKVKDIYPNYPEVDLLKIELGKLNSELEAKYRPSHFEGVVTVVYKLFQAIPANNVYFGKKDFQQVLVINKLVKTLKININIVACETEREFDGLAMSSRNVKLNNEERLAAALIYKALSFIKANYQKIGIMESTNKAKEIINRAENLDIEYLKVVNLKLEEVVKLDASEEIIACTAVYAGKTRLIDNINLN